MKLYWSQQKHVPSIEMLYLKLLPQFSSIFISCEKADIGVYS